MAREAGTSDESARAAGLRSIAARRGLVLERAPRRRQGTQHNAGGWQLQDGAGNVLAGEDYDASLDDVQSAILRSATAAGATREAKCS